MEHDIKQVVEIVTFTLQNKPYTEPIEHPKNIYNILKENGFSGMVYFTLQHGHYPPFFLDALKKEYYVYIAQATKQEKAIQDIKRLLNEKNIKHIFLKGTHLKTLYPKSYMRSMGDIDLLIQQKDLKPVHTVFENASFTNTVNSEAHDSFKHPNQSTIEVHPSLARNFDDTHYEHLDEPWSHTLKQSESTYTFDPTFELFYLIHHSAKHFYSSGIGLRNILDIALYLNHYKNEMNWDQFTTYTTASNLYNLSQNIFHLASYLFNADVPNSFMKDFQIKEDLLRILIRYITISGVHGTGEGFNRFITRFASTKKRFPKLHSFLRILFPSKKAMESMYPYVKRCILLYPLGFLSRLLRLLIRKRTTSIHKLKQLNINKTDINKAQELYDQLGL